MKLLVSATLAVLAALGGVAWFVSQRATDETRSAAELVEPAIDTPNESEAGPVELEAPDKSADTGSSGVDTPSAEPAQRRVAAKQIHGRILDATPRETAPKSAGASEVGAHSSTNTDESRAAAEGDAPIQHGIAAFTVHLKSGKDELATSVTDLDGRFAFPLVDRDALTVTVDERPNWQVLALPRALEPGERGGDVEVLLQARSLRSAPLVGVLVDTCHRQVLPRYLLRIEDETGHSVKLITDDRGAFTTPIALASGVVRIWPLDHEKRAQHLPMMTIEHDASATPQAIHTIEVASGPTFRLIVAPRVGPDPEGLVARLRWPSEDGPEKGPFEPVRAAEPYTKAGELPWVRLPPLAERVVDTEALEVRTTDGLWRGECAVTNRCGDVPNPVEVQLTAGARLEGVVHDSSGAIVAGAQVSVLYEPVLNKSSTRTTTTDREGNYRLDFMRAGSVTVSVKAMAQSPAESPCTLTAGQPTRADFTLTALPVVGSIRGIVTSDSGNYDADDIRVSLVSVENPGPKWRTKPHWETRRGARVATFAFDGLPAGKFIVEIEEHDWFEWEPRSVTIAAPRDDVELRVHDRPRIADLLFHVTDSDNGRVLDDFHVTTVGAASLRQFVNSDEVVLTGFRLDLRLNWRLDRAGYPPTFGSLASFNVETTVNGRPRRTVELNLRPGWGDHIQVVRKQNNKPIADAVVFVDGVETTVHTDKNGYADIVTRDRPKSVTISAPGWKQTDPFDLRPPSKRNWRFVHQVQMDPLPKKK